MNKISTINFELDGGYGDGLYLMVDGHNLLETPYFSDFRYDFSMIKKSLKGHGWYYLFKCGCSSTCDVVHGIGLNDKGIEVCHRGSVIEWKSGVLNDSIYFEKEQYQQAIHDASNLIDSLSKYPDRWDWAIALGNYEILKNELGDDYDCSRGDLEGALRLDSLEGFKFLIIHSVEYENALTEKDKEGRTIFHQMTRENNISYVEFLLTLSFDLQVFDNNGWTALDYALFENHHDLIKLLSTKGLKSKSCEDRINDIFY